MADTELKRRICRACNADYNYPVPKGRATRFHCESCAELPESIRETFERLNRRIRALENTVKAAAGPDANRS